MARRDKHDKRDKPDKRRKIMQAAEKLFRNRRVHEITIDEVAAAAGVGKGTIYLHFRDKDDLFFQTATAGFDDLCELLWRRIPEEAPFAEQLLGACEQISAFFKERRQLFRMMQTEEWRMYWCRGAMRERWLARREKLIDAVTRIVRKGLAEGAIREDLPPETLAVFLLGLLRTRGRAPAKSPEAKTSLKLLVDLFYRGAGRSGKGRAPKRQKRRTT